MGAVEHGGAAAAPQIGTCGTREADWTGWLSGISRQSAVNFVPAGSRLIVLAPHPDDEILACAGLLALHDAQGGVSLIIAATDGEASHAGCSRAPASPWAEPERFADLAQLRRGESTDGLQHLALQSCAVMRLGLPDGGLLQHLGALQQQLDSMLSPADTLLTTWRHDAHPDHEACGLAASRATGRCGCRLLEAPVWLWHWSHPSDDRVPWHRLAGLGLPVDVVHRKTQALAAHRSQLAPRDGVTGPVLGPDMVRRTQRDAEYFFIQAWQ